MVENLWNHNILIEILLQGKKFHTFYYFENQYWIIEKIAYYLKKF